MVPGYGSGETIRIPGFIFGFDKIEWFSKKMRSMIGIHQLSYLD